MDAAINPALAEARFCPRCGRLAEIPFPRSIVCPHCRYAVYFNPKPVAGAIPVDDEDRVILLRRGFEPGRGRWTFPGGFVDLGESVADAAHRETDEELGIAIDLGQLVGVYSRADDRGSRCLARREMQERGAPTAKLLWCAEMDELTCAAYPCFGWTVLGVELFLGNGGSSTSPPAATPVALVPVPTYHGADFARLRYNAAD